MDLTIKIKGNRITRNLFENSLALYLYILLCSYHPPSYFGSLVSGMILWLYRLCTYQKNSRYSLKKSYGHLLNRAYQHDSILPLFNKSIENAVYFTSTSNEYRLQMRPRLNTTCHEIFFHLKYNPSDPKSSEIQKLWRSSIFQLDGKPAFNQLKNCDLERVTVNKLVVCYSRHHNIENILSYCKICKRKGLNVSSCIWLDISKPLLVLTMIGAALGSSAEVLKLQISKMKIKKLRYLKVVPSPIQKRVFLVRTCIIHKSSIYIIWKLIWRGYTKSLKPCQMIDRLSILQYSMTTQAGKLECSVHPNFVSYFTFENNISKRTLYVKSLRPRQLWLVNFYLNTINEVFFQSTLPPKITTGAGVAGGSGVVVGAGCVRGARGRSGGDHGGRRKRSGIN